MTEPDRSYIKHPAERAIQEAVDRVEEMGASQELTAITTALGKLRERVAALANASEMGGPCPGGCGGLIEDHLEPDAHDPRVCLDIIAADRAKDRDIPQVCPHCAQNLDIVVRGKVIYVSAPQSDGVPPAVGATRTATLTWTGNEWTEDA